MVLCLADSFDALHLFGAEESSPAEASSTTQTAMPSGNKNNKNKNKKTSIVTRFDTYFGSGDLSDWQRLCKDIGLEGDFTSKTQCRKALKTVHINIFDLLDAVNAGTQVRRFKNQWELAKYCIETKRIYPKKKAKESGPVKDLLRIVFR